MMARSVKWLLGSFVASIPVAAWAVEVGVALTASHVLGMALAVVAGTIWLRDRRPVPVGWPGIALLAFLAVAAYSVVRVQSEADILVMGESAHAKSIKQLIGLLFGLVVFTGLRCLMRWYGLAPLVLRVHFWTTAIVATLALLQYGIAFWDLNHPLANWPVQNSTFGGTRPLSLMYGFPRISLTMVEPSMLAVYLLTGWAFWLFVWDRTPRAGVSSHWLFTLSGVVIGMAIVTSGSRLAYVVVAVMTLASLWLCSSRVIRVGLVGLSVVFGLLVTGPDHSRRLLASLLPQPSPPTSIQPPAGPAPGVPPSVVPSGEAVSPVERGPTGAVAGPKPSVLADAMRAVELSVAHNDPSVQQRVASYLVSVTALRERPWAGIGFGTSAFYMGRHWPASFTPLSELPSSAPVMMSHYATILTETGLLGALCLLVFAATVIAVPSRTRRYVLDARLSAGAAAALTAYALTSAATALVVYQSLLIWMLVAAAIELDGVVPQANRAIRERSYR